jgi:hypothetical protein
VVPGALAAKGDIERVTELAERVPGQRRRMDAAVHDRAAVAAIEPSR